VAHDFEDAAAQGYENANEDEWASICEEIQNFFESISIRSGELATNAYYVESPSEIASTPVGTT
ncbi:Uncharacterized protein FKW44_018189, partial [Caligus rogercresseyi]